MVSIGNGGHSSFRLPVDARFVNCFSCLRLPPCYQKETTNPEQGQTQETESNHPARHCKCLLFLVKHRIRILKAEPTQLSGLRRDAIHVANEIHNGGRVPGLQNLHWNRTQSRGTFALPPKHSSLFRIRRPTPRPAVCGRRENRLARPGGSMPYTTSDGSTGYTLRRHSKLPRTHASSMRPFPVSKRFQEMIVSDRETIRLPEKS